MYFKRKIDSALDAWLKKEDKFPALLVGIRQCGKTETIKEFAKRNGLQLIELNFWTNPEYCLDFNGKLDIETIINNISLRFPNIKIEPTKTLIFFDEIQDCPKARLSFKSFKNNSKYNVIGSGSYLGINGYIKGDDTPAPTGYENIFHMKTMDFEEFLWALGYSEEQINLLINYFNKKMAIPENIHNLYKEIFLKYICLGGFPKVVKEYLQNFYFILRLLN